MTDAEVIQHCEEFQRRWAAWKAAEPEASDTKMNDWVRWKLQEPKPLTPLPHELESLFTSESLSQAAQLAEGTKIDD